MNNQEDKIIEAKESGNLEQDKYKVTGNDFDQLPEPKESLLKRQCMDSVGEV